MKCLFLSGVAVEAWLHGARAEMQYLPCPGRKTVNRPSVVLSCASARSFLASSGFLLRAEVLIPGGSSETLTE